MKQLIKKLLREGLLDEAAFTTLDLPKGTGLFIKPNNSGVTLTLYNPKNKEVYATITFISNKLSAPYHYVSGVAAIKGYGPLIYELAFMYVDSINSRLMPSRDGDIRGEAFNVWEKMYDRIDIDKTEVDIKDDNFRFDIITGEDLFTTEKERIEWFNQSSEDEQYTLKVFNSAYCKTGSKEYAELIKVANNFTTFFKS